MKIQNFYISGTDISFTKKPSTFEIVEARKSFKTVEMEDLTAFKTYLEAGHPFIMATFMENENNKKDFDNLERCTGIALDFEGGSKAEWTEAKLMTFCEKYGIVPNIFYNSFSSTTRAPRFRIVYVMNRISPALFKSIATLVVMAFNAKNGCLKNDKNYGIDSQSILPTQQYNPGKGEVKILNEEYVDFQNFIIALNDIIGDKASKVIEKETNITSISDAREAYESCIGTYSHPYIDECGKKKFKTYQVIGKKSVRDNKIDSLMYNNTNSDLLLKKCRLAKELYTEKQDYYSYHLSTGLVYSLVKIRNGKEIYKRICENNASHSWKVKERVFDDIKRKDYMPQTCKNFGCPYLNSCPYSNGCPSNLSRPAFVNKKSASTISAEDGHEQMRNALDTAIHNKGVVDIIEAPVGIGKTFTIIEKINELITLTHAQQAILSEIRAVQEKKYMDDDVKVNAIRELKKSLKSENNYKFIIASPRHNLCQQIRNDLLAQPNIENSDVIYITQRPEIPNEKMEMEAKQLENLGLLSLEVFREYLKIFKYLNTFIEKNCNMNSSSFVLNDAIEHIGDEEYLNNLEYSKFDKKFTVKFITLATEYIKSREDSKDANIVVCTHSFLSHTDLERFTQKYLFIDEDCSESFVQTNKIKVSTIDKVIDILSKESYNYYGFDFGFEDIVKTLEFIKMHNDGKIYSYDLHNFLVSPDSRPNKKGICKKMMTGVNNKKLEKLIELKKTKKIDFTKILNLRSFCVEGEWVNYTTFQGLNTNGKKVILTSATPAPEFFYKNIFGMPINRTRIDFVELKGNLIQYYDMASYRKNLREDDYLDKIDKIKELEEIECVISYKAFNSKLNSILNFGNLEGINAYSGKNILVIGTYLVNPTICQLIAHMFDIPEHSAYSVYDIESVKQYKIEYNNIEQLFSTFENKEAREYQIWQCWKTTEQAIGRARLINNDCKVVLLSKLIHPLANLTTYDEEIEGGDF